MYVIIHCDKCCELNERGDLGRFLEEITCRSTEEGGDDIEDSA